MKGNNKRKGWWRELGLRSNVVLIIVVFIILFIGSFSFIESQFNKCELVINFGGPNYPYCKTMIAGLLLIPGWIPNIIIIDFLPSSLQDSSFLIVMAYIFNFIFYFLLIRGIKVWKKRRTDNL